MKEDHKSLAAWGMLSVIVTQLVVAPGILGWTTYFLIGKISKDKGWNQEFQYIGTLFATLIGLGIAFYRINQISSKLDQNTKNDDTPNQ